MDEPVKPVPEEKWTEEGLEKGKAAIRLQDWATAVSNLVNYNPVCVCGILGQLYDGTTNVEEIAAKHNDYMKDQRTVKTLCREVSQMSRVLTKEYGIRNPKVKSCIASAGGCLLGQFVQEQ